MRRPAIEPREGESKKRRVAKQTPGPMSGVAMTGRQGREPRTTEQPLGESSLNIQPRLPTWRQHGSPSPVQELSSERRTPAAVAVGGERLPPLPSVGGALIPSGSNADPLMMARQGRNGIERRQAPLQHAGTVQTMATGGSSPTWVQGVRTLRPAGPWACATP